MKGSTLFLIFVLLLSNEFVKSNNVFDCSSLYDHQTMYSTALLYISQGKNILPEWVDLSSMLTVFMQTH